MTYVPRSPRRTTKLRAVLFDGSTGVVRDMSTSGLFVHTSGGRSALTVGQRVAVVPLVGELDSERLPAEVARVGERGIALRFVGLNSEHRQRLRSIFGGDEKLLVSRARSLIPLPVIPDDAPVVLLTDEPAPDVLVPRPAPAPADLLVPALISSSAPGAQRALLEQIEELTEQIEELEGQIFQMIRDKGEENGALKRRVLALAARNALLVRVQDQLREAHETIFELEHAHDAQLQSLFREMQRLERSLSG